MTRFRSTNKNIPFKAFEQGVRGNRANRNNKKQNIPLKKFKVSFIVIFYIVVIFLLIILNLI